MDKKHIEVLGRIARLAEFSVEVSICSKSKEQLIIDAMVGQLKLILGEVEHALSVGEPKHISDVNVIRNILDKHGVKPEEVEALMTEFNGNIVQLDKGIPVWDPKDCPECGESIFHNAKCGRKDLRPTQIFRCKCSKEWAWYKSPTGQEQCLNCRTWCKPSDLKTEPEVRTQAEMNKIVRAARIHQMPPSKEEIVRKQHKVSVIKELEEKVADHVGQGYAVCYCPDCNRLKKLKLDDDNGDVW